MPGTTEMEFPDSNIFVYALGGDPAADAKVVRAQAIIAKTHIVTSTQVINEVCVNMRRIAKYDEVQILR